MSPDSAKCAPEAGGSTLRLEEGQPQDTSHTHPHTSGQRLAMPGAVWMSADIHGRGGVMSPALGQC
jgi:hypothetical protein